jgi:hypothetical protein
MTLRGLGRRTIGAGALAIALSGAATLHADALSPKVDGDLERVPSSAFWTGARLGVFIPYGALYSDSSLVSTPFQDVATAGPSMELDMGARFARHFVGYALFEQAFLGRGRNSTWTAPHGGQSAPSTQALGIGLRWESNPAGWGIVADVAVAYRWLTVRWDDATTIRMNGPGDVRFGLGATWRVTRSLTLAPMMTASSGAFANRTLDGQKLGESTGSYASLALTLSGHFDLD